MRAEIVAPARDALLVALPAIKIQEDPNIALDRGAGDTWARFSFQGDGEGAFETFGGEGGNIERGPLLAYCDIFTPLDSGDGDATALGEVVKGAWRRLSVDGARWQRFGPGAAEGVVDGQWRKQIVAVFLRSERV